MISASPDDLLLQREAQEKKEAEARAKAAEIFEKSQAELSVFYFLRTLLDDSLDFLMFEVFVFLCMWIWQTISC